MTTWQCAYCGYSNSADQKTCGQGETDGCGASRVEENNRLLGFGLTGSFLGEPIYANDLRLPELQQHEDFMLVLGP